MAEIDLEQCLGSAVRFIIDSDVEGSKAYFDEVPQSFYVPSVYFPVPSVECSKVTMQSYLNRVTFTVWFQARTDWEAEARCASVRDQLMMNNMKIPLCNKEDGSLNGKAVRVDNPIQRKIEEGIVALTLPIMDYFKTGFDPEEHEPKIWHMYIEWKKATSRYRQEEQETI